MSTVKRNFFPIFFYNVTLIPIAAGMLAAPAMAPSSISVVSNNLRLYNANIDWLSITAAGKGQE